MVITRRIEVYVAEEDKDLKKNFYKTIYGWSSDVRRAANAIIAHKFVQQNVRDFAYLQEDIMQAFLGEHPDRLAKNKKTGKEETQYFVSDILKDGKGMSEQNTTYRIVSSMLKGKVPADIYSCLNQAVAKTFKERLPEMLSGKMSVASYKNDIPMPFSSKALSNIHKADDGRYYFTLFGVPFACRLGADRSGNAIIIDRCISGEYKLCSSSLQINRQKNKVFLLLCADIPKKEVSVDPKKTMYAFLGVMNPIICTCDVRAAKEYDSGYKWFEIGTAEEFNHRRRQIQEAVKRCQINNRYSTGGKGRKRKCQAIDRWHDKENNYVDTKLHTYSRMLVDLAVKHGCGTIALLNQKPREDKAKEDNQKGEPFVLRNWSYYGLKEKIAYKCKMVGVNLVQDKEKEENDD